MMELPLVLEPDRDDPDCAAVCVDGSAEGRRRRFLVDTGAAVTQVPRAWLAHRSTSQGERTGEAALGSAHQHVAQLDSLRVGSLEVRKATVGVLAESRPHPWGLLGMDVLGREAWQFDFAEHQIDQGKADEQVRTAIDPYPDGLMCATGGNAPRNRQPALMIRCALGGVVAGPGCPGLQAGVDGLALEGENAEDALVHPVEGLAGDEALEGFDAEGVLA